MDLARQFTWQRSPCVMGKSQEMWEDSVQNWSRTGGAGAGPAMLRLCPKRSLQIHFRKALPCLPILICSQNVFSHHLTSDKTSHLSCTPLFTLAGAVLQRDPLDRCCNPVWQSTAELLFVIYNCFSFDIFDNILQVFIFF